MGSLLGAYIVSRKHAPGVFVTGASLGTFAAHVILRFLSESLSSLGSNEITVRISALVTLALGTGILVSIRRLERRAFIWTSAGLGALSLVRGSSRVLLLGSISGKSGQSLGQWIVQWVNPLVRFERLGPEPESESALPLVLIASLFFTTWTLGIWIQFHHTAKNIDYGVRKRLRSSRRRRVSRTLG